MYSEVTKRLLNSAIDRIFDEMSQDGPFMAQQARSWFCSLARSDQPADYFLHPLAFPMLLLPWWMEQTIHDRPDTRFQAALIFSSINGYYYIRLIDNVMDGHGSIEHKLLPMLGFFHTRFRRVYRDYFDDSHPFWSLFDSISDQSAESAIRDAMMEDIDPDEFSNIAGRKVAGGKIPLAAVAYRYESPQLYQQWQPFYDKLGCWHQMYNDVFGWTKDLYHETPSYFLSEARRRRGPDQTEMSWIINEGFDWGVHLLESWLDELHEVAAPLACPEIVSYLSTRRTLLQNQSVEVSDAFWKLERLLEVQS